MPIKPHAIDATLALGAGVGENAPEERIRNSRRGAASITAESTPVLTTIAARAPRSAAQRALAAVSDVVRDEFNQRRRPKPVVAPRTVRARPAPITYRS